MKEGLPEAESVADEAALQQGDKLAVSLDKLREVVKNSVFGDLLVENYGVEFSKLSFAIESRIF